jgi:hypothetical protein
MSDSISKYHELMQDSKQVHRSEHQRSVDSIVEILEASKRAKLRKDLLRQVVKISKEGPNLSPSVVFQIAADVVKVDELCNVQKK